MILVGFSNLNASVSGSLDIRLIRKPQPGVKCHHNGSKFFPPKKHLYIFTFTTEWRFYFGSHWEVKKNNNNQYPTLLWNTNTMFKLLKVPGILTWMLPEWGISWHYLNQCFAKHLCPLNSFCWGSALLSSLNAAAWAWSLATHYHLGFSKVWS